MLRSSLDALRALGDRDEMAVCLIALADIAIYLGENAEARGFLQQALALAQTARLRRIEAHSLLSLGRASEKQGDHSAAKDYYEQAQHIYCEIGDPLGEAKALNNLGNAVLLWLGASTESKTYYERALRISRGLGFRQGEGGVLHNLGLLCYKQRDYAGAKLYYEQALRIFHEIGNRWGEGLAINSLGLASYDQGDYIGAGDCFERALRIAREIGNRWGEEKTLGNLGLVSAKLGDYAAARRYQEQTRLISKEIGDQRVESHTLASLGLLYHLLGDDQAAQAYSRQALHIAKDLNMRPEQGACLTGLGHALVGLGCLTAAAEAYQQAIALRRELGQHHLAIESLAGLARVSLAQGAPSQAQAQVEEILSYLQTSTLEGTEEPLRIYWTCYRVLRANQDSRAQTILNEAHSLLQEWAAKIEDENLRRSFLQHVIVHREIMSAFAQRAAPWPACSAPTSASSPVLVEPLTERQTEVSRLIVAGLTNQEIAARLVISLSTVKYHVWHIYGKLGVRNRARAIKRARELGLVEEETSSQA